MQDHPGGDDLILNHAGKDITSLMVDPTEHVHSTASYDLMREYQVGVVGAEEAIVNKDFVMTDHFAPADTAISDDYSRNQFLDLDKPLLIQIWNSNFSKSFYLQQVHQPRHLSYSAKLFSQPYLEMFTLTPWWVVPLIWLPITFAMIYKSFFGQLAAGTSTGIAAATTLTCFLAGNVLWTILEYSFHRFLFHVDGLLPDTPFFLMLHFLLHGIHHYLPVRHRSLSLFRSNPDLFSSRQMDRLRLVMPPLLFVLLSAPFLKLAHTIFPTHIAYGVIAGAYFFYVGCSSTFLLLPCRRD